MLSITVKWIYFTISQVKWAVDFLLHHPSSSCTPHVLHLIDAHTVRRTVSTSGPDPDNAAAECEVCLCGIDAGEEIRRLRCNHVFHAACFDRWIGHGRWTCPLCRNHLTSVPGSDTHREILLFSFAQLTSSSGNKDTWWLR